uniref:Uncharacterized protein n=1 Tax=viral metagenome TaxID=1070528 RepID=A0A6C0AF40_9ZZZZ
MLKLTIINFNEEYIFTHDMIKRSKFLSNMFDEDDNLQINIKNFEDIYILLKENEPLKNYPKKFVLQIIPLISYLDIEDIIQDIKKLFNECYFSEKEIIKNFDYISENPLLKSVSVLCVVKKYNNISELNEIFLEEFNKLLYKGKNNFFLDKFLLILNYNLIPFNNKDKNNHSDIITIISDFYKDKEKFLRLNKTILPFIFTPNNLDELPLNNYLYSFIDPFSKKEYLLYSNDKDWKYLSFGKNYLYPIISRIEKIDPRLKIICTIPKYQYIIESNNNFELIRNKLDKLLSKCDNLEINKKNELKSTSILFSKLNNLLEIKKEKKIQSVELKLNLDKLLKIKYPRPKESKLIKEYEKKIREINDYKISLKEDIKIIKNNIDESIIEIDRSINECKEEISKLKYILEKSNGEYSYIEDFIIIDEKLYTSQKN